MKGWWRFVSVGLLATALLALFATATSTAAGIKEHDVDLFWTPDAQDIDPGPVVVDSFLSEGEPFGRELAATETPRSQTGGDIRTGKWTIYLGSGSVQNQNQARCFGTFNIDRNVIETTETHQEVQYGGVLRIKGCAKAKKFKNVKPGKLGTLEGGTNCNLRRCKGTLRIEGEIRY